MSRKFRVKHISIDEEKQKANEQWQAYLSKLEIVDFNREELIFQMQKMNFLDRRLIEMNRRDLLG